MVQLGKGAVSFYDNTDLLVIKLPCVCLVESNYVVETDSG